MTLYPVKLMYVVAEIFYFNDVYAVNNFASPFALYTLKPTLCVAVHIDCFVY